MNQTKKTLLTAAVIVILLVGATVAYNDLSRRYTPPTDGVTLPPPQETATEDTRIPEETEIQGESTTESAEGSETPEETAPPLEPAPDFTVQNTAGETVKLSDYIGKPVIINFWATWCGPCKSELPAFNEISAAYGESIHFLMINLTDGGTETVEKVTAFVNDNDYTFPLYFDTEAVAAATYGVYSIPLTVFVDAKGNLLGGHSGAMSEETLEAYADILLTYYAQP